MAENFLAVNYVRYEKDDSKSTRFLATPNPISPPNPLLSNAYSASAFLVSLRAVMDVLLSGLISKGDGVTVAI